MTGSELVRLASGYWEAATLHAAVKLELFADLRAEGGSAAALAARRDLSLLHTEALLDALVGLGILRKKGDSYSIQKELSAFLDPNSPDSLLPALQFNSDLFALWQQLPACVESGTPVLPGNPHLGKDPEKLRNFVQGMHSRASVMALQVLEAIDIPEGAKILDVGGGPGTMSVKLLERHPRAHSTVLDLPPVVSVGREIHKDRPELDRLEYLPGDYHHTAFPSGQDVVLYCGALHQEPEEGVDALFKKMAAALRPGGRLIVVDLFVDSTRTSPAYSALFQLNMMLMRPQSHVYSLEHAAQLLTSCGLHAVSIRQLSDSLYGIAEGQAPEDA